MRSKGSQPAAVGNKLQELTTSPRIAAKRRPRPNLDKSDETGFSIAIRELIFSEYLDVYYLERYQHRLSMEGQPLYYFAIAGRKNVDISQDFLKSIGIIA